MANTRLNILISVILLAFLIPNSLLADAPRVGRDAAAKYFGNPPADEVRSVAQDTTSGDRILMLQIGGFISSNAYEWGQSGKQEKVGKASYGVTYLFDQWHSIDVNIRGDFNEYKLADGRAIKFSIMPLWTIPMVDSNFPLYFGLGTGLGIYFKQIDDESNISFDYQLVTGFRMKDVLDTVGFVVEFGLKNHLHILSDGQFNGTALTVGTVFSF